MQFLKKILIFGHKNPVEREYEYLPVEDPSCDGGGEGMN